PDLLRQPEVGEVGLARFVQVHVSGLDVSMDEVPSVRGIEGFRNLAADAERVCRVQPSLSVADVLQLLAFDVAHADVELSAFAARGAGGRAWCVERGGSAARLLEGPLGDGFGCGEAGGDVFQSVRAVGPELGRPVDDAHPASADLFLDPIAGEGRARPELGCG